MHVYSSSPNGAGWSCDRAKPAPAVYALAPVFVPLPLPPRFPPTIADPDALMQIKISMKHKAEARKGTKFFEPPVDFILWR